MANDDLGNRPPGRLDDEVERGGNTGLVIALAVVAVIAIAWFGFGRHTDVGDRDGAAMHERSGGDEGEGGIRPAPAPAPAEPERAAPAPEPAQR